METPPELIAQTLTRVRALLDELYPEYISFDDTSFTLESGSTRIIIRVRPFTDQDTCIECMATVVSGAELRPDVLNFLLRKNAELHFGAFGLLFDGTIIFSHSIAGLNADRNELLTTIQSVAVIADHYDDEIVLMAGGKRAADLNIADYE